MRAYRSSTCDALIIDMRRRIERALARWGAHWVGSTLGGSERVCCGLTIHRAAIAPPQRQRDPAMSTADRKPIEYCAAWR